MDSCAKMLYKYSTVWPLHIRTEYVVVMVINKTRLTSRFYATTSDDAKSWKPTSVMEDRGHELEPREVGSHDDESACMEYRHSHGSINTFRPTIETVPARESSAIPIAQLLSPTYVHEHWACGY